MNKLSLSKQLLLAGSIVIFAAACHSKNTDMEQTQTPAQMEEPAQMDQDDSCHKPSCDEPAPAVPLEQEASCNKKKPCGQTTPPMREESSCKKKSCDDTSSSQALEESSPASQESAPSVQAGEPAADISEPVAEKSAPVQDTSAPVQSSNVVVPEVKIQSPAAEAPKLESVNSVSENSAPAPAESVQK